MNKDILKKKHTHTLEMHRDGKIHHWNKVIYEQYIARSHISMNDRTTMAFFMQKMQSILCSCYGNGISLVPVKRELPCIKVIQLVCFSFLYDFFIYVLKQKSKYA